MLLETVRIQRHRKRGLYALFVDIKEAYDRVHRTGLWVRLWQYGVRSKMWHVLHMAEILAQHARQWRYEINLKKTKYMSYVPQQAGR